MKSGSAIFKLNHIWYSGQAMSTIKYLYFNWFQWRDACSYVTLWSRAQLKGLTIAIGQKLNIFNICSPRKLSFVKQKPILTMSALVALVARYLAYIWTLCCLCAPRRAHSLRARMAFVKATPNALPYLSYRIWFSDISIFWDDFENR